MGEKGKGGCAQKTSTTSTAHMTLAKFPFVCCSGSTAHSIVLRLVVLFAARGNHNVCIIYLRFAFKGFKLLNYFLIWFFRLELRAVTTTTKIKTSQINMQISVLFIENIVKSGNG